MDFENLNRLPEFGFSGGVSVSDLQASCKSVPAEQGVYLVVRESDQPVRFLEVGTGGRFKGRDPSVSVSVLETRWLVQPKVLYVGKAGGISNRTTLQGRVHSLMRFGLGRPCAHWGGRYIWQLVDARKLAVFWKQTHEEPRQVEKAILCAFIERYGQLPFANLKR